MIKQGLRFYAILLLFVLAAKAWEDTAYDKHDFLGIKGKICLNINNYFPTSWPNTIAPTKTVSTTELNWDFVYSFQLLLHKLRENEKTRKSVYQLQLFLWVLVQFAQLKLDQLKSVHIFLFGRSFKKQTVKVGKLP